MDTDPVKPQNFNASDWISKGDAARLRGVSRQAIWELVRRGRFTKFFFAGRIYLSRSEVLNFKRRPRGPASQYNREEKIGDSPGKGKPKKKRLDPLKWISTSEAASIRGITRQAIVDLIRRGYLRTLENAGKTLVLRSSVEKFKPRPTGRGQKRTRVKKK